MLVGWAKEVGWRGRVEGLTMMMMTTIIVIVRCCGRSSFDAIDLR
jgi:hypothetical protein